jgi:hypothetical protein
MTTSTSKHAYNDCFSLYDRALSAPHGVRVPFPTRGAAQQFYVRMHSARIIARRESMEVYPSDDPAYGTSPYDILVVRQPVEAEGHWYLYVEPRVVKGEIEELGAAE